MTNQLRCALILLAAGALALGCRAERRRPAGPTTASPDRSPITVGPNVLVSAARPASDHTEYMADADPADPNRVMVCSMIYSQERNQLTSGLYASADGGTSWALALDDDSSRFGGVWDPACAFGGGGAAYFATLTFHDELKREDCNTYEKWSMKSPASDYMALRASSDGGRSWSAPVEVGFIDNEDINVDRTGGRFRGRVYVYGNSQPWSSLWLIHSEDAGRTWTRSAETRTAAGVDAIHAGPGTILPDGTLLLPYAVTRDKQAPAEAMTAAAVAASRDGGATLEQPVDVATYKSCWSRYTRPGVFDYDRAPGMVPTVVSSDHSAGPYAGRAYVAWGALQRDQCVLTLAHSDDQGRTWSLPVQVSDAPLRADGGPDMFLPQIAVNRAGVVGATWYDRREDPAGKNHRLRFSASLDGGDTWLASVPVSTHPFVFAHEAEYRAMSAALGGGRRRTGKPTDTFAVDVFTGPRLYEAGNNGNGDYAGIAAGADGRFHAFWIDNRTGVAQLYTAAIGVAGAAVREGHPELASLDNVTPLLEIEYTSNVYDPAQRTLALAYQLRNTSSETVTGPLELRLLGAASDLGPASVLTDDGVVVRVGDLIDVSSALINNRLAPGETTGTLHMRLRFGAGPVRTDRQTKIAHLDARVFGHKARRSP